MKRNVHLGSFVIYQIIDHFTGRLLEQHSTLPEGPFWVSGAWRECLLAAAGSCWHLLAAVGSDNCTVLTGGGPHFYISDFFSCHEIIRWKRLSISRFT